jgi:pyrroloquinoline quinone biosynthesis protein D
MTAGNHTAVPAFPRHVRLQHDTVRDRWVVLAPERMFVPDEQALEILRLVDGMRTVAVIAADLARRYDAPAEEIEDDVAAMLQDLAAKGAVTLS